MSETVFLNGSMIAAESASIDIYDHGFLYGDGVFEGIRAYDGKVFRLHEHVRRLFNSALALAIDIRMTQDEMTDAILGTVRANNHQSCYIRVSVSRGIGLGLDPSHIGDVPTVAISTRQLRLYPQSMYDEGLDVVTASTRVPPAVCIDPQIKSLGRYINNILAKMEANRVGAGEALMLNMMGNVAEATGDNLFLVRNGEVATPPTSEGALVGITRATVMACARAAGMAVHEIPITLYDCYTADEAFLTGTAAEVIPMVRLDNRRIGTGRPGPITKSLIERFRSCTATEGVPVYV